MTLADFSSPGLIIPSLRGETAASAIHELSQALQQERRIPDRLPFCHAVLQREEMASTEMEEGLAFPHARLTGLKQLSFAFGRRREPLEWRMNSVRSVRLVCLLAVPATDATQYLQLLSGLARLAKSSQLRATLHAAPDAAGMLDVLKQVELGTNSPSNLKKVALA